MKNNVPLSQVSNETLLDMYVDYKINVTNYKFRLDNDTSMDRVTRTYYYNKYVYEGETLEQIKLEILSRMMGMEID